MYAQMTSVKDNILLPSGDKMPIVGLGTWDLVGDELRDVLNLAFKIGYRHVDTAFIHGNEQEVGEIIREWLENKTLKRKDLFITSKLPPTGMDPEKVKHFCQLSLQNLGLSYIDLYQIQVPVGLRYCNDDQLFPNNPDGTIATDCGTDLEKIWTAMETLVEENLVRNIGLCNFNQEQLERVMQSANIKPANLQIEIHAYFQQRSIRTFCKENGISVTASCPLGSVNRDPILFSQPHQKSELLKLLQEPAVTSLAEKCNRTPAQILLRHAIQKQIIVIPKSSREKNLKENLNIFDFYLIPSEMKQLDELNKGQKGRSFDYSFLGESFLAHQEFPFRLEIDDSNPPAH